MSLDLIGVGDLWDICQQRSFIYKISCSGQFGVKFFQGLFY